MGQLFISYARADSRVVDQMVEQIEGAGHQVWIDRSGIQPGSQWSEIIVEAVESADLVLAILSINSVNSDNVRREIDLAVSAKKRIMPISIEEVEIPPALKYQLAGVQILDYNTEGLRPLLQFLDRYKEPTMESKEAWPTKKRSQRKGSDRNKIAWYYFLFLFIGALVFCYVISYITPSIQPSLTLFFVPVGLTLITALFYFLYRNLKG